MVISYLSFPSVQCEQQIFLHSAPFYVSADVQDEGPGRIFSNHLKATDTAMRTEKPDKRFKQSVSIEFEVSLRKTRQKNPGNYRQQYQFCAI